MSIFEDIALLARNNSARAFRGTKSGLNKRGITLDSTAGWFSRVMGLGEAGRAAGSVYGFGEAVWDAGQARKAAQPFLNGAGNQVTSIRKRLDYARQLNTVGRRGRTALGDVWSWLSAGDVGAFNAGPGAALGQTRSRAGAIAARGIGAYAALDFMNPFGLGFGD